MKTILRLALIVVAATTGLMLAGNAFATQQLSVRQDPASLSVKVSQAQSDPQPAKVTVYVPSGYTLNTSQAPGTKIGTATGNSFVRDQNIALPLAGDIVVAPPDTNATGCATGTHLAVWTVDLQVGGESQKLPVHIDATTGSETALGAYKLVFCLPPADVPKDTPGRSPNGAQLLDATFKLDGVFTAPAGERIWKAITTPWTPGLPIPNPTAMIETRAVVSSGAVSLASKVLSAAKRIVKFSGRVTQFGSPLAGIQVNLLIDGNARFRARTDATGSYSKSLKRIGKRSVSIFQARVTVAERDITSTGCKSPSVPTVRCVSATASPFTALSSKIKVRI
jgi:hypothetical protein